MLERIAHPNGLVTYQSPLLRAIGVTHGFTTRLGGASKPPYDTLNLGVLAKGSGHDTNTTVSENFRRVRAALGLERIPRYEVHQVHGADVWEAPEKPVRWADAPKADAIITDQPGKLLVIRTADCVPILIASANGRQVAAVHAGWRGLVAGVIQAAASRFNRGAVAAIGPAISPLHYEVGPDVADRFSGKDIQHLNNRPHLDLTAAATDALAEAGITAIDLTDRCTYRDADEFFSHRRDVTHQNQPNTGRMAALITPAPPPEVFPCTAPPLPGAPKVSPARPRA